MKSKKNIKSIVILAALGIATLFFINISLAANTAKVNVETANLRETANSESKILEQLSLNQEVEVIEKGNEWCKVKVDGITGYIKEDLITINGEINTAEQTETSTEEKVENVQNEETTLNQEERETKKIVVEDTKLKIVPSINATEIIEVKKDQEVTITETINGWVCIQTETTKGWIRNDKLKSVEENEAETAQNSDDEEKSEETTEEVVLKTLYVNTTTVNLRKEASTDSEIVTRLSLNTSVDVYAEENGWSKVKVNGNEGYISSSLLSNEKQETSRSQSTPRTQTTQSTTTTTETTTVPSSGKGATVVETAKNYIGCSYVYGASGPSSFDCSGFTSYVFKLHGVSLNRTAAGQYSNGVAVSRDQLQPGDLVMFGKSGINHVGIYIGGGQIVHAANPSRGVTIDTINSGYYNNNYVGARRVI
ncbi:MAG: SH3 domain-containing protein [Clostridia bacterium]